jgi:hypothetical protein
VIDETVRPIQGATVTVPIPGANAKTFTTTEDGVFGFNDLTPGTYFIQATAPGFGPIQTNTEVVAGVDEPEVVRVMLTALPSVDPTVQEIKFDGFLQCATYTVILLFSVDCTSPLGYVDARFMTLTFDPNATWAQSQMFWQAATPLAEWLRLDYNYPQAADYGVVSGPSPLLWFRDAAGLGDIATNGGEFRSITWVYGEMPVGAAIQQDFQIFSHLFYNCVPKEGWTFEIDAYDHGCGSDE